MQGGMKLSINIKVTSSKYRLWHSKLDINIVSKFSCLMHLYFSQEYAVQRHACTLQGPRKRYLLNVSLIPLDSFNFLTCCCCCSFPLQALYSQLFRECLGVNLRQRTDSKSRVRNMRCFSWPTSDGDDFRIFIPPDAREFRTFPPPFLPPWVGRVSLGLNSRDIFTR